MNCRAINFVAIVTLNHICRIPFTINECITAGPTDGLTKRNSKVVRIDLKRMKALVLSLCDLYEAN